jgi:hypothetical protein
MSEKSGTSEKSMLLMLLIIKSIKSKSAFIGFAFLTSLDP